MFWAHAIDTCAKVDINSPFLKAFVTLLSNGLPPEVINYVIMYELSNGLPPEVINYVIMYEPVRLWKARMERERGFARKIKQGN